MSVVSPPSPSSHSESPQQLASLVRKALLAERGLDIASLVVRRVPNGVCLEGVVNVNGDDVDVCRSVRQLEGVGEILNHLVVCWNCPPGNNQPPEEDTF